MKLPNLSLEEVDHMMKLPVPKLTRRVKKRYAEDLAHVRAHISSRTAGSSSVSIASIYAPPLSYIHEIIYIACS